MMAIRNGLLLLCGAAAAATFTGTYIALGLLSPGYDPISQTISELGESGSHFEQIFRVLMLASAVLIGLFSLGLYRYSRTGHLNPLTSALLAWLFICQIGVFIFEAPHYMHNVFGISSMISFLAPLVLAATWDSERYGTSRVISGVAAFLLICAIAANMSPVFIDFEKTDFIRSHYGAIQRMLYLIFYGWVA
jgi:hypothetical membrane protein